MRLAAALTVSFSIALLGMPAQAQDVDTPRRGDRAPRQERLDPEQARAVWEVQANGVAQRLELSPEQATEMTKAYVAAREQFIEGMRELREKARAEARERNQQADEADRGRGRRGAGPGFAMGSRELIKSEAEKLHKTIAAFLDEEQARAAAASLGTFDAQWDGMVHAIMGFELPAENNAAALNHIESYVIATSKIRQMEDRQSMMASMREARDELMARLDEVLEEEQMSRFEQATRRRIGRRNMAERLLEMDANGDGKLQRDEVPERMREMFDRLDTNGDGVLDADELNAGPARGRRGRGGDIF
jgi:hypothetical protein